MIDPRADTIESCLKALDAEADLYELIDQHPELRPALEAAAQAQQLGNSPIPLSAQQRSRTQVLARAAELRSNPNLAHGLFARLPRLAMAALIAVCAFLASSSLLMIASARSLPGDQLYTVKRSVEELRLNLSSNPVKLEHIEEQYRARRIEEIQQLLSQQRREMVSFDGIISQRGERHWLVSDVKVIVAPETVIIGEINIGNLVEVEGVTEPEGWLRASEIHLREYEILGVVEALSNPVWVVSGLEVQISPETQIDPKIQIGSQVKVLLHANDDGSRYAVWILFVTPSPTATPTPTLTATLQPTHTPIFIELNQDGERDDSKQETPSIEETDKPEEIDKKDDSEDSDDSEDKGGEEHEGGEEDGGGE